MGDERQINDEAAGELERLRLIYEHSPLGMGFISADGVLTDCNDALASLFGTARKALIGAPIKTGIIDEGIAVVIAKAFSGMTGVFEGEYTPPGKPKIMLRTIHAPLYSRKGELKGVLFVAEDVSDRKLMEDRLRESERRYKTIVESQAEFVVRYLPGGTLAFVNDTLCRYLNMKREDLLGRSYYPFMHADDRAEFIGKIEALDRKDPVMEAEARVVLPDGRVAWHRWTHHAIFDDRGKPVEYQSTGRDVTELKEAEERIRASEARFRAVFENSRDAIGVSRAGTHLFANPAYRRLFTLPENAELNGRPVLDLIAPGSRAKIAEFIRRRSLGEEVDAHYETRGLRADGSEFDMEVDVSDYREQGESCTLVILRDITERKRAGEKLRESEAKYKFLIETTKTGFVIIGGDGLVVDANEEYARLSGHDRIEDILGRSVVEWTAAHDRERNAKEVKRCAETGFVRNLEIDYAHRDGRFIPVEINATVMRTGDTIRIFTLCRDITERKRAQEELAGQKAMLQQILDASSVAIFLVDKDGRITSANHRMAEMFGRTMDDLAGSEYVSLVHPSERETGRRKMLALLASEIPSVDLDRHYWRKDGTEFWGHLTGRRFHDVHGNELGLIGVISDITESKQTEEALRKSEKMLHTIIDAEPECVKLLDENACLIMMNRAGLDMLQVDSLDQVKGQCVCPMVTSAYRQDFLELTKRVFRGESGTLLFEMVGLKGRHLWLETHAVPLRNEKDEIIALLGVTRDVTERKKTEDALRRSEERFRDLAESLPLTVFEMDLQGRFTYVNKAAMEKFGYSQQEVDAGLTMAQVIAPGDRDRAREIMGRRLAGRTNGYIEYQGLRKDGSSFPVTVASSPILRDGRPVGLRGIVTDVSERKQLEQELLKTQKLESLGTLAGGIAHDFNNLLQGLFGYISMAKLTIDQREKSLAMLAQAEKALHQSVNLTSQLLTFSKGGKPVKKAVDLRPVIENAVKFALSGSPVSYDLAFGHDLSAVEADEGQIGQVVQNIVLNAEQSMPLGGRIEIAARNAPQSRASGRNLAAPHGLVEIVVRDQGMGIPSEHLPRIFDPYFTTKEKGSGLGLATSYSIVKNHGGMIDVSSVLGKGSTFTVHLPATRAAREQAASSPASGACAAGRTCRVLVMDDEEIVRVVAGELLRELGHEAEFAGNGGTAVEKYRRAVAEGRPFDVVILDLTIRGGMGGLETLRKLKELDPGVKAVVSSGYSDDAETADYQSYGFRSFLKKPYNIEQLQDVLSRLMA